MIDECPSHRAMPFAKHVVVRVDLQGSEIAPRWRRVDDLRDFGRQCAVVSETGVRPGEHTLAIRTTVTGKSSFVLISTLVWF